VPEFSAKINEHVPPGGEGRCCDRDMALPGKNLGCVGNFRENLARDSRYVLWSRFVGEQGHDFIASQPGDHVVLAHAFFESSSNFLQKLVSGKVTQIRQTGEARLQSVRWVRAR
jgi:hypothetical protein